MSRFAHLADKVPDERKTTKRKVVASSTIPPSRIGRKTISGYFSPELSMALHHCARKNDLCLQELMAEAFNDVLRKYGESPVGN